MGWRIKWGSYLGYTFRFTPVLERFDQLLEGAWLTIQLSGSAMLIGLLLSILCALVKTSGPRPLAWVVNAYVELIRNTPFLVQIFFIFFALPAVLLAIVVMAILGRGVENAMIAIAIVYAPIFARVTRGAVIAVRDREFVNAARALGQGRLRIMFAHVLPNSLGPIIVQTSLSLAFAILSEAADAKLDSAVMGMAHRGRLNVLVNLVGKTYGQLFKEFEGNVDPNSTQGSGDVKYHLGQTGKFTSRAGNAIEVLDPDCVEVSFPGFWSLLDRLGHG